MGEDMREIEFEKSAIIVAHPDDEVLWFNSVLTKVDKIIICYLDYSGDRSLGEGRRKALEDYPLTNITCLGLNEPDSFDLANWNDPEETAYGLRLGNGKKHIYAYMNSYKSLHEKFSELLRDFKNIYTHNPWGEYGHEDHVQVYRVIKELQASYSYNIWYSNYVSNRSSKLMMKYLANGKSSYKTRKTDKIFAKQIEELYRKNNCWTWYRDFEWFDEEAMICEFSQEERESSQNSGYGLPMNMLMVDFRRSDNSLGVIGVLRRMLIKILNKEI